MIFPMGLRALAVTEAVSLYGGLAVFGGFVLFEYVAVLVNRIEADYSCSLVHRKFFNMLG